VSGPSRQNGEHMQGQKWRTSADFPEPGKCPRPCSECDENHHWIEVCPDPDGGDDDDNALTHEAYAVHGLAAWYSCKHCEAWVDEVEDYEEPAPAETP
jgi:hypothetical protein